MRKTSAYGLSVTLHLALVAIAGALAYSNTLHAPFLWDDTMFVLNNPIVMDSHYLLHPTDARGLYGYMSFALRYVTYATFALNYQLHGWDVLGFHLFNLAAHIINGFLVYLLVREILNSVYVRNSTVGLPEGRTPVAALMASLLFVVHPLQTEAVTYVFQRHVLLVTMFYLLSVITFMRYRAGGGRAYYAASVVAALLAIKSKENAFTLPLAIVMVDVMFMSGGRRAILRALPHALMVMALPLALAGHSGQTGNLIGGISTVADSLTDMTPRNYEYLLTQFPVLVRYLRLLVLPTGQNIDYDFPVYSSFMNGPVVFSFMLLALVAGAGVWLYVRSTKKGTPVIYRLAAFGAAWFFLALSIESSIIPIPMVINEYRVYLPSAGVLVAVSVGLASVPVHIWRRFVIYALALWILALWSATYQRNALWAEPTLLWSDAAGKSPTKPRTLYNAGTVYMEAGEYAVAEGYLLRANGFAPDVPEILNNLGVIYAVTGRKDEALGIFRRSLSVSADNPEAWFNIGKIMMDRAGPPEAESSIREALKLRPEYPEALNTLSIILRAGGDDVAAEAALSRAVEISPGFSEAWNNLGNIYIEGGRYPQALEALDRSVALEPERLSSRFNRGVALLMLRRPQLAREDLLRAANLSKEPDADTYKYLGHCELVLGNPEGALGYYRQALEVEPGNAEIISIVKRLRQ